MRSPDRREEILTAAERLIRRSGYAAVSTRRVAETVGIRAASLHHHFPTKADLVEAVAARYAARFVDGLGPASAFEGRPEAAIAHVAEAFRASLRRDGALCLCAVLAAETGGLPAEVASGARAFFHATLDWLAAAIGGPEAEARALHVLAALEGGMLIANALGESWPLDRVAERIGRAA